MKPKKPVRFKGGAITVLLLILCLSVSTISAYMMASDSIATSFTIGEITPRISLAAELNEGIMVFPGTQLISSMFTVRAATGEVLDPSEYTLFPEIAPGTIGTFSLKVLPVGNKYRQAVVDVPNESPEHVLEAGPDFNSRIPDAATSIIFTDTTAPSGATVTDVSAAENGSVVSWADGNTMYVSSQEAGAKIIGHKDMSSMFANKHQLSNIDVTLVDTSRATTFASMYQETGYSATALNIVGMDAWSTSNVTDMSQMFHGCVALTEIDLSSWDTSKVANMYIMFEYCCNAKSIIIDTWDTSKVENMDNMFFCCENLTSLDLSKWDVSNVKTMQKMFNMDIKLETLGDISNWNTSSLETTYLMFGDCYALEKLDLSGWNTLSMKNISHMFFSCTALKSVNCTNWNTSNVTDMSYFLFNTTSFEQCDLSNWDVSNVTDMAEMFRCSGMNSSIWSVGDLSNWNTSKVTDMHFMFNGAYRYGPGEFNIGDIGKWDVSNVTDMHYFLDAVAEKAVTVYIGDLSGWNTSSVTNMSYMFEFFGRSAVFTQDLSAWDVSKVTAYEHFISGESEGQFILPNFS